MGQDPLYTATLLLGIFLGLGGVFLALLKRIWACALLTLFSITSMVFLRHFLRVELLRPYFHIQDLEVSLEYSPMLVFFIALVLGLGLILYLIKLALNQKTEVRT